MGAGEASAGSLASCLSPLGENGVALNIYVQPRASRTRLTGLHDGNLRLAITAPPVEGQANKQIVAFLAKLLGVPKKAVTIVGGQQGRTKRLAIDGIELSEAATALLAALQDQHEPGRSSPGR